MTVRSKAVRICVVVLVLGFVWWHQTRYFGLSISVLQHANGNAFWSEIEFSRLSFSDSPGSLYLHRRSGTAYAHRHGWTTVEEAFAHFDKQLREQGWERRLIYSEGDPALPESSLLPASQFREYCRPGDEWGYSGQVAVAIWPIGATGTAFRVVIVSAKPSLLHRLHDELR